SHSSRYALHLHDALPILNELSKKNLLNLDCMAVTGKTVGENIAGCENLNPEVIRPIDNPYSETGGLAVLKGNLAPDGRGVKRSADRKSTRLNSSHRSSSY